MCPVVNRLPNCLTVFTGTHSNISKPTIHRASSYMDKAEMSVSLPKVIITLIAYCLIFSFTVIMISLQLFSLDKQGHALEWLIQVIDLMMLFSFVLFS